jgi:hypothetical protein
MSDCQVKTWRPVGPASSDAVARLFRPLELFTNNLPESPKLPQRNIVVDSLLSIGSALVVGLGALLAFRERGGGGGDA